MSTRFATESDLPRVNALRKQVNDLHVKGKPDVFKSGFSQELQDHIHTVFRDPQQWIAVCERDGSICGFAVLHRINKPENPFMKERDYLDIDEFCVDEAYRRTGVGTELMAFVSTWARENGFSKIELNMWEFNRDALQFYEAVGFTTYRRYMELFL